MQEGVATAVSVDGYALTAFGVLAGLLSGTATTFVWYLTPSLKERLYELIPAFAVSLLATLLVSRLTRPPEDADTLMASMTDA